METADTAPAKMTDEQIREDLAVQIRHLRGEAENFAAKIEGAYQDVLDRRGMVGFWLVAALYDGVICGWSIGCPNGARVQIPEAGNNFVDEDLDATIATVWTAFLSAQTALPEDLDVAAVRVQVSELIGERVAWLLGPGDDFVEQIKNEYEDCLAFFARAGRFWLIPVLDDVGMLSGWSVGCPTGAVVQIPEPTEIEAKEGADPTYDCEATVDAFIRCLTATPASEEAWEEAHPAPVEEEAAAGEW